MIGYAIVVVTMVFDISFDSINSTDFITAINISLITAGVAPRYVMNLNLYAGSVVADVTMSDGNGYYDAIAKSVSNGIFSITYENETYTASDVSTSTTVTKTKTSTTETRTTSLVSTMPPRDVPFASGGLDLTKEKMLVAAAFAGTAGSLVFIILIIVP